MAYLHWLELAVRTVVRENRPWMTWNLLLAAIPAALGVVLFRTQRRRGPLWWCGVVLFALFLPNAPYVASDLRYLHPTMSGAESRGVVVTGVLPLFAVYLGMGFFFYWSAVRALVGEVARWKPNLRPAWVIAVTHLFCTVGVFFGRVGRLNSWSALTNPLATVDRSVDSLASPGAPVHLVVALAAIAMGYAVMAAMVRGGGELTARLANLVHRPQALRGGPSRAAT